MLGSIAVVISLIVMVLTVGEFFATEERIRNESYRKGYNDSLLDIDEILSNWKEQDIKTVGIDTIRNRIAEEYMND